MGDFLKQTWQKTISGAILLLTVLASIEPAMEFLRKTSPFFIEPIVQLIGFLGLQITFTLPLGLVILFAFLSLTLLFRMLKTKSEKQSEIKRNLREGIELFKNLWITWHWDDYYEVFEIAEMRCGVCRRSIIGSIVSEGAVYLTCSQCHCVGTDQDPNEIKCNESHFWTLDKMPSRELLNQVDFEFKENLSLRKFEYDLAVKNPLGDHVESSQKSPSV